MTPSLAPAAEERAQSIQHDSATELTSITSLDAAAAALTLQEGPDHQMPGMPMELVERILRYTFLPQHPLTPSSDPHHLRNTAHLLRVSKAFRELSLPVFFERVFIARPADYDTFFGEGTGIFVVGEEGRRRWGYVKCLGFGYLVLPPARFPLDVDGLWIVPLIPPEPESLKTVVFFDQEVCPPHDPKLIPDHVADQAMKDDEFMGTQMIDVVADFSQSIYWASGGRDIYDWAESSFGHDLGTELLDRTLDAAVSRIEGSRTEFFGQLVRTFHGSQKGLASTVYHLSDDLIHLKILLQIGAQQRRRRGRIHIVLHHRTRPAPDPPIASTSLESLPLPLRIHLVRRLLTVTAWTLKGFTQDDPPLLLTEYLTIPSDRPAWEPWRFARNDSGGLLLVPSRTYQQLIRTGKLTALPDAEERAWSGLPPVVVAEKEDEAST